MGVGIKIKELRKKKGLTQNELADKLHVTYQAVSRWENGDTEPSYDTLKQLATIFECTTDELLDLDTKPKETIKTEVVEKVV